MVGSTSRGSVTGVRSTKITPEGKASAALAAVERQPGLADTARAGQRQQSNARLPQE